MAKKDEIIVIDEKEVAKRMDDEEFLVRAIFEMIGKPKDHIEKTLQEYIAHFSQDDNYHVVSYDMHEAEPYEDKDLFSTFAEVEFIVKDQIGLLNFCVDFMPASVEVLEPDKLAIDAPYMSDLLTELVGRMHLIDGEFKKVVAEKKAVSESLTIMVQNAILLFLHMGPKDIESISKAVGVPKEQLAPYLDKLIAAKQIALKDSVYGLLMKEQTK